MKKIIYVLLTVSLVTCEIFSQLNIQGKYTMVQTAFEGNLKTDVGTMEIRALDAGRYELITCEPKYGCGDPEIFTLEGDVLKFENDVVSGVFKENGNLLFYQISTLIYPTYMCVASKVGAKTTSRLTPKLINDTKSTEKCPCCKKEYKKLDGYFMYKENGRWGTFTAKEDLLLKGKGRYTCSEGCASKHQFNKCPK
jgi:hypothetical protein